MIHKTKPFIEGRKPLFLRKNQLTFHVTGKAREFIISLAQNLCIFCHFLLPEKPEKTHLKFMVYHKYKNFFSRIKMKKCMESELL